VTKAGSNTYQYDANGNQTKRVVDGQTFTLSYDAENRLVSVTGPSLTASFVYNGDGRRVKSPVNGTTTYFIGAHYEVTVTTVTKYYFAGTQRVAVRTGSTLKYLLGDHLGPTSIVTSVSGGLLMETRYRLAF
jgi:YD repeat-containing protein